MKYIYDKISPLHKRIKKFAKLFVVDRVKRLMIEERRGGNGVLFPRTKVIFSNVICVEISPRLLPECRADCIRRSERGFGKIQFCGEMQMTPRSWEGRRMGFRSSEILRQRSGAVQ